MRALRERLAERLHLPIAVACVWLMLSSPWLQMRRLVPAEPGWINGLHLALGLVMAVLAAVYFLALMPNGRWRELYPWAAGRFGPLLRDLSGLLRARIPGAGGAGLYSVIQGLLVLALLAVAWTGVGWWASDGARIALAWREWHQLAAQVFGVLLVLHVVAVATHFLDFFGE
ncbi:MAG: cytochrome b/b6 domain-containing protein [Wenzhouxiangellaceae bacterium]|nr:cytochrome b/b6 domain-containing protein [Wenzhouxiangellaceae bacterium]